MHLNWTLKYKERKVNGKIFRMKDWSEKMVNFLGFGGKWPA